MTTFLRRFSQAAAALALATLTPTPGAAPLVAQSADNARYASIVVDATSGEVLFSRYADTPRYPASITKVMTLYVVFDALESGKVRLTDRITVSPRAASRPPSKLGLAAGQTITVDNAIRSLAVRSANDMAVALAEHVGGSEARFATLMTQKSQSLGMSRSRWFNANGLPDARQRSSARDLSILSRAVMRDYPQYYHFFGQQTWVYNGREYRNTNGLLHAGYGYDGIKTGFTNASGYNLAASAVRGGNRIVTVVLGGRTTRSRNDHVAELMNTGFELASRRAAGEPIQLSQTFFEQRGFGLGAPDASPYPESTVAYASLPEEPEEEVGGERDSGVAYTDVVAAPDGTAFNTPSASPALPVGTAYAEVAAAFPPPTTTPAPTPSPGRPLTLTEALNATATMEPVDSRPAPPTARPAAARATTPRATPPRRPAGQWAVQVGSFRDEAVAKNWLTEINRRFRAQFTTAESVVVSAGGWYRSRFTGLTQTAAELACDALVERKVTCLVIKPD